MDKWIEASQIPEGEKVYLMKDWLGWRVVSPWKNEDGSINWFNFLFSGKRNLILLIFLMLLFGLFYIGINELIDNYKKIAESPCDFCESCHEQTRKVLEQTKNPSFNLPKNFSFDNILKTGGDS